MKPTLPLCYVILSLLLSTQQPVIASFPLEDAAEDPNSASIGAAINETCLTGANGESPDPVSRQFQSDCNVLVGGAIGGDSGVSTALRSVAMDQISAQNQAASGQALLQTAIVSSRMLALRDGEEYPLYAYDMPESGGGASADIGMGSLGFFFNLQYANSEYAQNLFAAGYDNDLKGVTAGMDYPLNPNAILGLAVNFGSDDIAYRYRAGNLDIKDWGLTLYGSYYLDNGAFIDATLGYGWIDYDMRRNIRYRVGATQVDQQARSSTDGKRLSFSIGGGYSLSRNAWTFTPTARLEYLGNDVDGFQERISDPLTSGGGMAMSIDSAEYRSLTTNIGALLSYAASHSWGVMVPQVHLEWIHEFDNDQQSIDGRFIADVNRTGFIVQNAKPDRNYFNLGIGVVAQFANGRSGFLSLDSIQGYDDLDYYSIRGGIRLEF